MKKKVFSCLAIIGIIAGLAHASLPPTTTKGSGDANPFVTFNFQFPNQTVSHSGVTATIGTLSIAGGGTGQTTAAAALSALGGVPSTGSSSITTVGTITSGTWNGSTIPIAFGGTGQTTAAGAVTALGAEPAIAIGTTLQYWRGDKTFQTLNTTVVPEGTNKYMTTAGIRAVLSASPPLNFDSGTGIFSIPLSTNAVDGYLNAADHTTFSSAATTVNQATSANTALAIVRRDASGNFSAGTITAGTFSGALAASNITGTLSISQGGTGQTTASAAFNALSPLTTKGDILTYSTTNARLGVGTSGYVLTADPSQATGLNWILSSNSKTAPTIQKFTSGSGTYTTPTSPAPLYIHIKMVGAGGGGGGGGAGAAGGGTGGNTTFGTSLLTCAGGAGGSVGSNSGGGVGGDPTINSPAIAIIGMTGNDGFPAGASGLGSAYSYPGNGGAGAFGGGRAQQAGVNGAGLAGRTNSGSGGTGAGSGSNTAAATGGGAGAYIEAIISSPSATYSYAVGAAGSAGAGAALGGAGGSG